MTQRLTLEKMTPTMARSMLRREPRPGDVWAVGYPMPDELDVVRDYLSAIETSTEHPFFGLYIIRLEGVAVGGIGFFGPPDHAGAAELGYGLVEEFRGRGLATEALSALLAAAGANGALVVRAETEVDNVQSQAVLMRAGMAEVSRQAGLSCWAITLAHPNPHSH